MNHFARVFQVDVALGSGVHKFGVQAGEEGREPIEIVLRPLLPRMIVAAGALDANAEKRLAYVGRHIAGVELARHEIEVGFRLVKQISLAD